MIRMQMNADFQDAIKTEIFPAFICITHVHAMEIFLSVRNTILDKSMNLLTSVTLVHFSIFGSGSVTL